MKINVKLQKAFIVLYALYGCKTRTLKLEEENKYLNSSIQKDSGIKILEKL